MVFEVSQWASGARLLHASEQPGIDGAAQRKRCFVYEEDQPGNRQNGELRLPMGGEQPFEPFGELHAEEQKPKGGRQTDEDGGELGDQRAPEPGQQEAQQGPQGRKQAAGQQPKQPLLWGIQGSQAARQPGQEQADDAQSHRDAVLLKKHLQ